MSTPLMDRLSKLANDCGALEKSQPNISPLLLAEMAATATLASGEIELLRRKCAPDWRPIELAPKTGRFLIGGHTLTGGGPFHIETVAYRDRKGMPLMHDDHFVATHWAPLPEPPSKGGV